MSKKCEKGVTLHVLDGFNALGDSLEGWGRITITGLRCKGARWKRAMGVKW